MIPILPDLKRKTCPDCGLVSNLVDRPHKCRVPLLRAAAGVELTEAEERAIRWLARYGAEADVFIGLLKKVRGA